MFRRLAICAALLAPALGLAQVPMRAPADYRETEAVLTRYPALPEVKLDSPAFRAAEPALTSQEAMMAFLEQLSRQSNRLWLASLGASPQGRNLPVVYLTSEGLDDPAAIKRLGRPVVWLIGQQHGNEPAGGEAMLALASSLALGELAPLLAKVSVVIVPRANVDGAAADRRVVASGADPNRDHLLLRQRETRLIHRAMRELAPHVVFDHHEFSVAWRWLEKFDALQAADVMILEATNPIIPKALTDIERALYRPALDKAIKSHGLMPYDYVTTGIDASDRRVSLGGTAADIARNTFGLAGSVSYLIETRGVGIGLQSYQRRVATHYLLAKSVLETTAADPQGLLTRLSEARQATTSNHADLVVTHTEGEHQIELPLIDPHSGAPKPTKVQLVDSRDIKPLEVRSRPAGYLVLRDGDDVAERLALNGAVSCRVAKAGEMPVEAYALTRLARTSKRESINPEQILRAELKRRTIEVPAGARYVPMAQPAAGIVAAALEPDSSGSYLGAGVIAMRAEENEAPIFRVMSQALAPCVP
jgi:hypothetical protein